MKNEEFMKKWKEFQNKYFNNEIQISIEDFDFINKNLEQVYNMMIEETQKKGV